MQLANDPGVAKWLESLNIKPPRPVALHAGSPDAGSPDAGLPDAGSPDAGLPDSGLPDSGLPDSGLPDSGGIYPGLAGSDAAAGLDAADGKDSGSDGKDSGSDGLGEPASNSATATQPRRPASVPLISVSRPAMACEFEVLLNRGQHAGSVERAMESLDLIEQLEGLLSIYRPTSELSAINRQAVNRPVEVSPSTMNMLELAKSLNQMTEGAFDLTAGILSDIWGFSRRQGQMPGKADVDAAMTKVGSKHLVLGQNRRVSSAVDGLKINPGGIGKGFALDRAAHSLRLAGVDNFMMHGGLSSIIACGDPASTHPNDGWQVALKHPLRPEEPLGRLHLRNQALGTSGSAKQFFHFRGRRYSHIIDPRTGWPAEGMLSATVVCDSGAIADALATALFVMGPQAATEFCSRFDDLAAVLVYNKPNTRQLTVQPVNMPEQTWTPASQ